jgi:integrase
VTGIVGIFSGLLRFGVKNGQLERNHVRDLDRDDRPGVARVTEPRYLSADELAGLLAKLGETFRPVVACCTFAALRISEALGLTWRDVDFDANTLTIRGQLGTDGTVVPVKSAASAATVPLLPAWRASSRRTAHAWPGKTCAASMPTRSCSRRAEVSLSPAATHSGPYTRPVMR